ncbi:MAG: hypothetical protein ACYSU0_15705 [Planctomycetota bacterium]|jgi:hypothetical protein
MVPSRAELDALKSELVSLAEEVERLHRLKADYIAAIGKFKGEGDGLAERPGCLGGLFGSSAKPAGDRVQTADPGARDGGAQTTESAVTKIRKIRSLVAEVEGRASLGTRNGSEGNEAGIEELYEAYVKTIAWLKAEKEELIS